MAEIITEKVNNREEDKKFDNRWWAFPEADMYQHVFGTLGMLETRQSFRSLENVRHARLYSDLDIVGFWSGLYSQTMRDGPVPNRISLNVIKSCIDTVQSKIAKTKTRPMFLTEDGNFALQNKAKNLTKFMDGQMDAMGHYETKQDTFRDASIFGSGFTKFYIDYQAKKVCSERVVCEELITDDGDAIYGRPRTLFQKRLVNRDLLKALFPGNDVAIEEATTGIPGMANNVRDVVKVVEAWHLPSSPGGSDGKHFFGIDNKTLQVKNWKFDWFPFSKEMWTKPITGWYGIGLARELTDIQLSINKILRNIQRSIELFAIPKVFVENSSQVNLAAINNDIGAIVKYSGVAAPQFYTPQAMSPDVYMHLWNLYAKAYEISGISQLSAGSKKPQGLDSGKALREYSDIESDRFQIVAQDREQSFLTDAKIIIEFNKVLAKEDPSYKVQVSDQGSMKTIKWSEVDLDETKYIMRIFPASILPTQPAAKMQSIIELTQSGFLDKETSMDLMDFPDLQAATSRLISQRRLVFKILDDMVENGEYQAPEPYFINMPWVQNYSQMYYMDAKLKGVPEDRLELLRTFIQDATTINNLAAQGAQAMLPQGPVPGPGGDQGSQPGMDATIAKPDAQPTSDLLPVA